MSKDKLTTQIGLLFREAAAAAGLHGRGLNVIRDKTSSLYDPTFPPRIHGRFDEAAIHAWKKNRDDRANPQPPIESTNTHRDRRANIENRRKT